jgi:hypothetical protein
VRNEREGNAIKIRMLPNACTPHVDISVIVIAAPLAPMPVHDDVDQRRVQSK